MRPPPWSWYRGKGAATSASAPSTSHSSEDCETERIVIFSFDSSLLFYSTQVKTVVAMAFPGASFDPPNMPRQMPDASHLPSYKEWWRQTVAALNTLMNLLATTTVTDTRLLLMDAALRLFNVLIRASSVQCFVSASGTSDSSNANNTLANVDSSLIYPRQQIQNTAESGWTSQAWDHTAGPSHINHLPPEPAKSTTPGETSSAMDHVTMSWRRGYQFRSDYPSVQATSSPEAHLPPTTSVTVPMTEHQQPTSRSAFWRDTTVPTRSMADPNDELIDLVSPVAPDPRAQEFPVTPDATFYDGHPPTTFPLTGILESDSRSTVGDSHVVPRSATPQVTYTTNHPIPTAAAQKYVAKATSGLAQRQKNKPSQAKSHQPTKKNQRGLCPICGTRQCIHIRA